MKRFNQLDFNHIIGGSFDYWQRVAGNTTTVNTASTVLGYTADRSGHASSGGTVKNYSLLRSTDKPALNDLTFSKQFNCLTAITSYAAADIIQPFFHIIEGNVIRNCIGEKVTFGFFIKSSLAGLVPISFRTIASGTRSYVTTVTVEAGEINTWVFKKVTIQLESTNINMDSLGGMQIDLMAAGGTSFQAPSLNQWVAGDYRNVSGSINPMATNTTTIRIAGMMLLRGEINLDGTEFIRAGRTPAAELALCQRYYEKSYDLDSPPTTSISLGSIVYVCVNSGVGGLRQYVPFKTAKRTTPIGTIYSSTGAINNIRNVSNSTDLAAQSQNLGQHGMEMSNTATGAASNVYNFHFTADAEY